MAKGVKRLLSDDRMTCSREVFKDLTQTITQHISAESIGGRAKHWTGVVPPETGPEWDNIELDVRSLYDLRLSAFSVFNEIVALYQSQGHGFCRRRFERLNEHVQSFEVSEALNGGNDLTDEKMLERGIAEGDDYYHAFVTLINGCLAEATASVSASTPAQEECIKQGKVAKELPIATGVGCAELEQEG